MLCFFFLEKFKNPFEQWKFFFGEVRSGLLSTWTVQKNKETRDIGKSHLAAADVVVEKDDSPLYQKKAHEKPLHRTAI